jgi:hypothetical protein
MDSKVFPSKGGKEVDDRSRTGTNMTEREELDIKIAALEKLTCREFASLEKLMNEKFANIDEATRLQAAEYMRRLDALNHEAAQLKSMQATYVSREMNDTQHADMYSKINEIKLGETHFIPKEVHSLLIERVEKLELNKANLEGKASQSSVFIAWGIAAAGIILAVVGLIIGR